MNPAFIIIAAIAIVAIWVLAARFFKDIGERAIDVADNVINEMSDDDDDIEIDVF